MKFDQGYQSKMQAYENLVPMKCKLCNSYAFAIDLKPQKIRDPINEESKQIYPNKSNDANSQKKTVILGEKVCINCKENKINEGKQEFAEQNQSGNNDISC